MAQRNRNVSSRDASSSISGSSSRREKRERDGGSGIGVDARAFESKRSRMAEADDARGDAEEELETEPDEVPDDVCPITDKDEKPFRLMDMPPEIRIEIYRACLTRPFDIMLSKEPKPAEREKERAVVTEFGVDDDGDDDDDDDDDEYGNDGFEDLMLRPEDFVDGRLRSSNTAAASAVEPFGAASNTSTWTGVRALRSLTRSNPQRSESLSATAGSGSDNAAPSASQATMLYPPPTRRSRIPGVHTINPPRGRRSAPTGVPTNSVIITPPRAPRPQDVDALLVNLLRASKLVYKESRAILYGENSFLLDLETAQPTLAALHQRSRGQIKNLRVTIPTHNEILERFAEVVRLSLRYCWRLQRLVVHMPFVLPGADGSSTSGNTTVYANAFDILRWLPRQCEVVLEGNVCEEIRKVVEKNSNLAKSLDEVSCNRRMLTYAPLVKREDDSRVD
jgi:hypothetical protein